MTVAEQIDFLAGKYRNYAEFVRSSKEGGETSLHFVDLIKDKSHIIILGEIHSTSFNASLFHAAYDVATAALSIQDVMIAVEEPVIFKGNQLISRAGLTNEQIRDYDRSSETLLTKFPDINASIIHNIFTRQVERGEFPNTSRSPAENLLRPDGSRFINMDSINIDMAKNLKDLSDLHEVVVFPVGYYHTIGSNSVVAELMKDGWDIDF